MKINLSINLKTELESGDLIILKDLNSKKKQVVALFSAFEENINIIFLDTMEIFNCSNYFELDDMLANYYDIAEYKFNKLGYEIVEIISGDKIELRKIN